MLTAAGRDFLLTGGLGNSITFIGLANETGTEIAGGSPAYARQAVTWTASSGGIRDNTADKTFDIGGAPGTPLTVARVLLRAASSGGTDYGWGPVGGFAPLVAIVDSATDAFTNYAHGLTTGSRVFLDAISGGSLPTGTAAGFLYYVVNASTNTFQVSTTAGGAAVNVTASGECWVTQCVPETFNAQGQYTILAGDLDLWALPI